MVRLQPGSLNAFAGSMAEAMEDALNELLVDDGMDPLSTDPNDREVRDRRRFLIAIARGVVDHLVDRREAFTIERSDGVEVFPELESE